MNIVHVVTLVSEDGAFGGPVTVARQQCGELARRGHTVTLLAGWDGRAEIRTEADVRLFRVHKLVPGQGFSGLAAPAMLRQVRTLARSADVFHVHIARDLVTLPVATLVAGRVPLVLQPHGMIKEDRRIRARVLDAMMTRRVIRAAQARTTLTADDAQGLIDVAGSVRNTPIRNGVTPPATHDQLTINKSSIDDRNPTVLFCARLHPRKRVIAFAKAAQILVSSGFEANFVVAGPDEGDLRLLTEFIAESGLSSSVSYIGPLAPDSVAPMMRAADLYVLPSEDEPFPMSLLEALAEGTPSVITTGTSIHRDLSDREAVIVTDGTPYELARAIRRVLSDPELSEMLRSNGFKAIEDAYSIDRVVDALELTYTQVRKRPISTRRMTDR